MVNKSYINYWIDAGLFLSFLACAATGIIKFPGLLNLLNVKIPINIFIIITRVHDWSGIILAALCLAHIALHWKWMVVMTKKIFFRKRRDE